MALVIVRVKWVCNFMFSFYCDFGDGDGDYDDKEEPTTHLILDSSSSPMVHGPLPSPPLPLRSLPEIPDS